jgi:hypothetical protein
MEGHVSMFWVISVSHPALVTSVTIMQSLKEHHCKMRIYNLQEIKIFKLWQQSNRQAISFGHFT